MIPAAVILLIAAVIVLWVSTRQRKASGLPLGRVVYSDTRGWGRVEKPLYDPETGLVGRPDYLVEQGDMLIPVEVKSARAPGVPYDSHVFQLAAYCFLVERTYGKRPPYGLLRYRDRTFEIEYTPALEEELEDMLDRMRQDASKTTSHSKTLLARQGLPRSHNDAARCARCGYRSECDQHL